MNRLDKIVGPENWWDDYTTTENCVVCRLTIRLTDGTTITKVDAGGHAGMSDEGDDEKSAFSDAFKRAAVKFGIGRHLYGDGIPAFLPESGKTNSELPTSKKQVTAWIKSIDPTYQNGITKRFKEYGLSLSYPESIADWTDDQAVTVYQWLSTQLETESKEGK